MSAADNKALEALDEEICRLFGAMWSPSLDKLAGVLAKYGWENTVSAEHNHPPSCCCASLDMAASYSPDDDYCPACVIHGTFACICGTPGLTYAGPERDCPSHGEKSGEHPIIDHPAWEGK